MAVWMRNVLLAALAVATLAGNVGRLAAWIENVERLRGCGGRGQCCCHAHVLVLLISHVTDISPSPEFVWGGCSNSAICFYRHGTGWWGPSFQCQRPTVDNAEANPHFTFHVVVPFAGTIYDPSYGVTGHAPFLETAPAHPEAASFQSGSALPVAAHYVDWTCGPH